MSAQKACPNCNATIPVHDGVPSWCEQCNWGVKPHVVEAEDGFLARLYVRAGERYGRAALDRLKAASEESLLSSWTLSTATGYLVAACVHALTVLLAAAGVLLIATQYDEMLVLFLGIALCAFAWLMRPRPGEMPKEDIVQASEFPALYAFVNAIAGQLGGQPVNHIVVNEDFNASYGVVGWQRRPVLTIGLPLWISLAPRERVAVIAHEIAHGVNGDGTRSFMVYAALNALDTWIGYLRGVYYRAGDGFELLAGYVTWGLSYPFTFIEGLLVQLLFFDKQRAEYLADYLAATVAGTGAMVSALHRLSSGELLHDVLLKSAYSSSQSGVGMLNRFRARLKTLPGREWERLARAAQLENARLDASHPPTAFRVEFLQTHPEATPGFSATEADFAAIDRELSGLEEQMGQRLIGRYARD